MSRCSTNVSLVFPDLRDAVMDVAKEEELTVSALMREAFLSHIIHLGYPSDTIQKCEQLVVKALGRAPRRRSEET